MGIGPSAEKDKHSNQITPSSSGSSSAYPDILPPSPRGTALKSIPITGKKHIVPINDESESPVMIMSPPTHDMTIVKSPVSSPITGRNSPLSHPNEVPTVFSWTHGGKNVYVAGNFNSWKEKIQMRQSHSDFTVIQTLPPGIYHYRFVVDGKWQTDPNLPTFTDSNGEINNVIEVKEQKKEDTIFHKKFVNQSPPGSYGQLAFDDTDTSEPPSLPPHLMRALLNTAPPKADPTQLPLPHHVMLNHLYSLPRKEDNMMIVGITHRYKQKFVTTVFYKPVEPPSHLSSSNSLMMPDPISESLERLSDPMLT